MLGRYMISRRDRVGDWERAQIAGARFAVIMSESDCEETVDPAVVVSRDAPRRCRSTESQSLALSVDEV